MTTDNQRNQLRSYLLGDLPEDESLALTEQLFTNETLFESYLEAKNDLFDEYVSESLNHEDKKKFEGYLKTLPDGKSELATAYVLRKTFAIEPATPKVLITTESSPSRTIWQTLTDLLVGRKFAFQFALATAALVLVFGTLFFLYIQKQRQENLARQEPVRTEPTPQPSPSTQNGNTPDNPKVEPSPKPKPSPSPSPQKSVQEPGMSFATVFFTSLRAGASNPEILTVSKDTKGAKFYLPADPNNKTANYKVILQDENGNKVFESTKVFRQGKSVVLQLSLSQLPQDNYKINLIELNKSGDEIMTQEFFFKIERK